VFTPRGVVLINPPRRKVLQDVEAAGGGRRALGWVMEGMKTRTLLDATVRQTASSTRELLLAQGFSPATVEAMVAAIPEPPPEAQGPASIDLGDLVRAPAERQAKALALATFDSRRTIGDLTKAAKSDRALNLYEQVYPASLRRAGLERVELIDKFPVLTGQFGYSRGNPAPGATRLRAYREKSGEYLVYGELVETEALFLRLDPLIVHRWLVRAGCDLAPVDDAVSAAYSILQAMGPETYLTPSSMSEVGRLATTLVHSFAHAFIRRAAVFAGIERSALSEVVMPHLLGFFVYAAARGDFVLGGLQAVFESELNRLLDGLVADEQRCALDPGCEDNGSACAVCLHLGETSCRMFNVLLSRKTLAGEGAGYFDLVSSLA
jgi:hypothetical protein